MKLISGVLACGFIFLASSGLANSEMPPPVVQPDRIKDDWKWPDVSTPPLQQMIDHPPVRTAPIYGLYTDAKMYQKYRAAIKEVGWTSILIGGPLDDETMRMLLEDKMEVAKTLGAWILNDPNATKKGGAGPRAGFESDDAFLEACLKAVDKFMTRYAPGGTFFKDNPDLPNRPIKFIEAWTEPNNQYMIGDSTANAFDRRVELYAKMLPAFYKEIKSKWPTVTVLGFACSSAPFIGQVHQKNPEVAKSYDVISTHPSSWPLPHERQDVLPDGNTAKIRDVLKKYGAENKPFWYTQFGWTILQSEGGKFASEPHYQGTQISSVLAAAYVCRSYALCMRLGILGADIMYIVDADNFNGGFFDEEKWRPSAYAVKTMTHLMPNPKLIGAISDGHWGYYAYQFLADASDKNSKPVIMAWNIEGLKTVEIPWKKPKAIVKDMFGYSKEINSAEGKISVELGPCPVYLSE